MFIFMGNSNCFATKCGRSRDPNLGGDPFLADPCFTVRTKFVGKYKAMLIWFNRCLITFATISCAFTFCVEILTTQHQFRCSRKESAFWICLNLNPNPDLRARLHRRAANDITITLCAWRPLLQHHRWHQTKFRSVCQSFNYILSLPSMNTGKFATLYAYLRKCNLHI